MEKLLVERREIPNSIKLLLEAEEHHKKQKVVIRKGRSTKFPDSQKCLKEGCLSKRQAGPLKFCIRHGGGNRCESKDCNKIVIYPARHCYAHGGIKCDVPECLNLQGTRCRPYCKIHGLELKPSYREKMRLREIEKNEKREERRRSTERKKQDAESFKIKIKLTQPIEDENRTLDEEDEENMVFESKMEMVFDKTKSIAVL